MNDFKEIKRKYRPIPFWSWNDKLDVQQTKEQVEMMAEGGMGGFFMHARGGLQTEYMSEEWFENIQEGIETAHRLGMSPWLYDENGWPSGFGNGVINGLGLDYQQKYLRMEDEFIHKDTAITKSGEHWFYFEVNPLYVDTLNREVVDKFIEIAYKPYFERFGTKFSGVFTDEPQISRKGIPWSFTIEEEYEKRYGEDIKQHLEELFIDIGEYKETRIKFWRMVTEMFSENFMKPLYEQCSEWGIKLIGHLILEETLECQLTTNGACMPHYEYFHIPGMDWLGREIFDCLTALQVSSVAEQLGKENVLSEAFAMCGHNVSFSELKGIYESQMVRGINLLCTHLLGYSMRGIRKRDYPPALFYQQPWWKEYRNFVDAMSREGMVLAESKKDVDILLLHPQTTAWSEFKVDDREKIKILNNEFQKRISILEHKHIQFHLGDEIIMKRHARVDKGKIIIGNHSYSYIIDECCEQILPETRKMIDEFIRTGGQIITVEQVKPNPVTDNEEIVYTRRLGDGFLVHYFVNTSDKRKKAKIMVGGRKLDIYSGELTDFCEDYEFEPYGSLMLIDDGEYAVKKPYQCEDIINVENEFKIIGEVENVLVLDKCDYYFDNVLEEKDGYVLNICESKYYKNSKVTYVNAYSCAECTVRAFARALFGKFEFEGKSSVEL